MSIRPLILSLMLAAATVSPLAVGAARAETDVLKSKIDAEAPTRPRLIVAIADKNNLVSALNNKLSQFRRFELVNKPNAKNVLKSKNITVDAKLSVQKSRQALALLGADLLLDGKVEGIGGDLRVVCRLYNFRTGEISRDLSLVASTQDVEGMAGQLAGFVRQSVPIQCVIRSMTDDQVILDMGAMDGVRNESMYKVYRYPQNLKPREVGQVRIIKADPFAAAGEVESTIGGLKVEPGDILVEDTGASMLSP